MRLPTQLLTQITYALQRPPRFGHFPDRLWTEIEAPGWAYVHQVENLVQAMDGRTHGLRLRDFAHLAGYPVQDVYQRPRFKNASAFSLQMIEASDVVGFCIYFKQLGFSVAPGP